MLNYTGHPLVDVGVATITAFAEQVDPAQVTTDDLARLADELQRLYCNEPMKSLLSVVFPNSGFTQPAFDKQPAKRAAYADLVLRAWQHAPAASDDRCVFFGTPAAMRAYREMVPLIGAIDRFNFYAEGQSGLPISGAALLAIQALPLGALKCQGRLLLLHASDPQLTYRFAAQALERNRRFLSLAAQEGTSKYSDAKFPRTQIIACFLAADQQRRDEAVDSVTAYHLTNYGPNPAVDIYHLPLQVAGFLREAHDATYRAAWLRLVRRAWEGGDGHSVEPPSRDVFDLPAQRNVLYEDLFDLPRDAQRFLRTYLLRTPRVERTTKDDQRRTYRLIDELDLVSWPLTRLFLERILNVTPDRIEAIRTMADQLATYIQRENDRRLFRLFLHGGNRYNDYHELRMRLVRSDYQAAQRDQPLFTLDQFIAVFEDTDDRSWWLLARDLLLIRMIEQLHAQGWITANRELVVDANADTELAEA